jgi:hypothetical protein
MAVRPAPRREPPYDDELARPALQLVRGRDRELPFPDPPATAMPALLAPVALPDPAAWARRLLLGLAETAAGRRPLSQVAALLGPGVCRGLAADFDRATNSGTRHWLHNAAVRTVHVSRPGDTVAELAATVQAGRRVHAVALRLEARHGRWWCTRLQMA